MCLDKFELAACLAVWTFITISETSIANALITFSAMIFLDQELKAQAALGLLWLLVVFDVVFGLDCLVHCLWLYIKRVNYIITCFRTYKSVINISAFLLFAIKTWELILQWSKWVFQWQYLVAVITNIEIALPIAVALAAIYRRLNAAKITSYPRIMMLDTELMAQRAPLSVTRDRSANYAIHLHLIANTT